VACSAGVGTYTWQKAKLPGAAKQGKGKYISSIVVGPKGAIAVATRTIPFAQETLDRPLWVSANGEKWKVVELPNGATFPSELSGIGVVGDRFLGVKHDGTVLQGAGTKWKSIKKPFAAGANGDTKGIEAVTSTPTGIAMTGRDVFESGGMNGVPAVWTTTDGKDWNRIALPPNETPRAGIPTKIAALPGGGLAVASGGTGLWVAPDGLTWEAVALPFVDDSTVIWSLTGTDTGLLLVTSQLADDKRSYVSSAIWSSVDGFEWQSALAVDSTFLTASSGPLGVVMANGGTLLQSIDAGATWSEGPAPADLGGLALTALAQTPDGRLLAGTISPQNELALWAGTPAK
jgi:hypothetical protein